MEKLSPSLTVKRLLPEYVASNYPQFVLFLEKYYEFLEQRGEAYGVLGSMDTFYDVDEQTDEQILNIIFGPVLKDFPTNIAVDRKFLYKHASEFFRSKGSLESVETLFRILYNEEIRIYLPKEDVLKVSSGNWVKRIAIQIDNVRYTNGDAADPLNMIGKELVQYDSSTGGILARGVVEDIDFVGTKITLYLAAEKQLREFDSAIPVVAIDSQDPEIEARVEATIEKGRIASLTIRNAGLGYVRVPDVVFYGGRFNTGKNAVAKAIITNGRLVGFTIQNYGEGYLRAPQVRVVNQILADIQQSLGTVTVENGGEYYKEGMEIPIANSNGSGERFRISAVHGGSIERIDVLDSGSDYSENDEIVFDNVSQDNYNLFIAPETYSYSVWDKNNMSVEDSVDFFSYSTVDSNGSTIPVTSPRAATRLTPNDTATVHELYQVVPSRADELYTASFYVKPEYAVTQINVTAGGSGYTSAPTVEFTGGSAEIEATATAIVSGGAVTSIVVDTGGRGYTSIPTVRLTGGGGLGATAVAVINTEIDQLELQIGVEKPAKAVPVISGGKVYAINLIDGGANYTAAPTVTFYGGDGSGATATANISGGKVTSFNFDSNTNGGSGYLNQSPAVYFSKLNFGSVVFDLKNLTVVSTTTTGAAATFSGNITPEADGVMRVSITGKIPGLVLNDNVCVSLIPRKSTASNPRAFALTDDSRGLLVFGALLDQNSGVRPYVNVPSVSTAVASIGELGIEEILLENNDKIAVGDDAFVFEKNDGVIIGARVLIPGAAYQYKPNITIQSSTQSGVGATAEAVMGRGGGVNNIVLGSVGSGYIGDGIPTDTYRRWQAGMVVFRNQILRYGNNLYIIGGKDTAVTTVAPPTHTNSTPVIFDTSATYTYYGKAATITISAPDQQGSQYVGSVALSNGGSGYTRPPKVRFGSPTGTGKRPEAYATIVNGSVTAIVLNDGGSGYNGTTEVFIDPPDGPGMTAQAVVTMVPSNVSAVQATAEPIIDDGGYITGVTITNAGAGYTTLPTVTITSPQIKTGSPPILVADIAGSSLIGVKITNGGNGYVAPPIVTVDPPSSQVLYLTLASGGSGFTSTPTLTITGGGGSGAVASATVAGGAIVSVTLLSRGTGYTSNPTVVVTGGGGSGANITATINSSVLSGGVQAVASVGASVPIISVSPTNDTMTIAPEYMAWLRPGDHMQFKSTGTLPAPLQDETYYHIGFFNGNTFKVLDEEDGMPIDLTTAGTGTRSMVVVLIADEILEDPTSTKNVLYESNDLIISEVNEDRYHLTVPEQNYIYVEPATTYTAQGVTFVEKVELTPPAVTVMNPISFGFRSNPDPIVLGNPYELYLEIYSTPEFVSALNVNQCLVYTDASGLSIPGLVSGTRYYVQDIDIVGNGFTLSTEVGGTRVPFRGVGRSLSVISFNTVIDALFFATGESSQLVVGDTIFLYSEPGATLPEPLTDRTFYKVQQVSGSGYIKIANMSTPGTAINLTTSGSGLWRVLKTTAMSNHNFASVANTWTMPLGSVSSFADNDSVFYEASGTPAGNMLNDRLYYINSLNESTGEFALSKVFGNGAVDVLDLGSGTHSIRKVSAASNRIQFSESDYNRFAEGTEVEYLPTGGVTAVATASIDSITGAITDYTVTNQGDNYASTPTVTIVDSATARPLGGIVLRTGGSGYTSAPTVNIEGGGGAGATATATVVDGVVTSITLDTVGAGYSVPPNVTLTGGGASIQATAVAYIKPVGIGATAHAVMGSGGNADKVVDIAIDNPGSGYYSAQVIIDAPDTKIVPLKTGKAYFLTQPDDATHSFKLTDIAGGIPITFKSAGTGTHTFRTTARYLSFDPSLLGRYIDDVNNIFYTSIHKEGVLSPFYSESLNTESLDSILLETSDVNKNIRDHVALESATAVSIVAEDNSIDTGTGVFFHTNSSADFGLTAGGFYYVRRIANDTGNGFKFYTTPEDAIDDTNVVPLDKTGITFLRTDDFMRIVRYDLVSQETGKIVSVNLTNNGKFYKTLPRVHVNVTDGRFGSGAILNPIGDRVGAISKIEVINPGYSYENDEPLVFPLNIHMDKPTKNFIVGERVEFGMSEIATVVSWDPHTFVLSVNVDDGEMVFVNDLVYGVTSGAESIVVEATEAAATARTTALTKYDGYYNGRKNLIDEVNIRVQDSKVYQDFSYVIRSSKPFSEYETMLKKLVHPSGMYVSGDVNYSIIATNAGINTVRIASTVVTSEAYSG